MFKNREISEKLEKPPNFNENDYLVLSIDNDGRIKYFNKECEDIFGYRKNDVINKQFHFLIPDRFFDQWKKMFESVKQNKQIDDFKLPWVNKNGEEIGAKWSIAPVGKNGNQIGSIGLVGKLIEIESDTNRHFKLSTLNSSSSAERGDKVVYEMDDKKIYFRDKSTNTRPSIKINTTQDNIDIIEKKVDNAKPKKTTKTKKVKKTKNSKKSKDDVDYQDLIKQYDSKNLQKRYEDFNKSVRSIKNLEEKNKELQKENKKLKKDKQRQNEKIQKTKTQSKNAENNFKELTQTSQKWISFLINCIGLNKKREEFHQIVRDLEERKQILTDFEDNITIEKSNLNKRQNDFIKWREKLEFLEDEVEKRRIEIVGQEERFEQKLIDSLKNNVCMKNTTGEHVSDGKLDAAVKPEDSEDHHDVLDKMSQSAAIVQRGVLKQINNSFAERAPITATRAPCATW